MAQMKKHGPDALEILEAIHVTCREAIQCLDNGEECDVEAVIAYIAWHLRENDVKPEVLR